MDSSIEQLKAAVDLLLDRDSDSDYEVGTLGDASEAARVISELFTDVNESLRRGWEVVSKFFGNIQQGVHSLSFELSTDLNRFIEETRAAELAAQQAVEESNQVAEQILKELGLYEDNI